MVGSKHLVKSFGLKDGQVFHGYRITKCLGRGWTAEVYAATEIATGARRALKIFANYEGQQLIRQQKRVSTYAAALEKISDIGITPRYYHLGHAFIEDPLGNYFIVQEHVIGQPLKSGMCAQSQVDDFLEGLRQIHDEFDYVLSDWDLSNLFITEQAGIRMIDADLGTGDGLTGDCSRDYKRAEDLLKSLIR